MFVLGGLGPPEYKITDLEDPPRDFSFMVPTESLLVMSGADDGHLMSFLEQVDHVLLSLHGSVVVESLHSWSAMVEVEGQHCFSSVGQEEGCEPCGSVWVILRLHRIAGISTTHRSAYLLSRSKMRGLSP